MISCARAFCVAANALVLTACARTPSLPFYRTAEMKPEWLASDAVAERTMHHVGAFRMVDQRGDTVTEQSFAGKATLVQFFFTTCRDICPTTTTNLAAVLDAERDPRVQLLSYSVTPERDSVGALQAFARARGIVDPRWHLVHGSRDDVARLASQSYFVRLGDGTTYGVQSIEHTETLVLVDGHGRLRGVYAGTLQLEMDRLREDLATLLKAAP